MIDYRYCAISDYIFSSREFRIALVSLFDRSHESISLALDETISVRLQWASGSERVRKTPANEIRNVAQSRMIQCGFCESVIFAKSLVNRLRGYEVACDKETRCAQTERKLRQHSLNTRSKRNNDLIERAISLFRLPLFLAGRLNVAFTRK